jgi:ribA/ribD-fused uncharacterized protein
MEFTYEKSEAYQQIFNTDDEIFEYFWETKSPYSQWHPSTFRLNGIEFPTAEHYMMYQKAMLFNDLKAAQQILIAKIPRDVKGIGKSVKGFTDKKWNPAKVQIVFDANQAKFQQNPKLLDALLKTQGKTLVEASPYDKIWGIGLAKEDGNAWTRETWKGENLLGRILTELRYQILGKL